MWIYGRHPVREALRAGIVPRRIVIAEGAELPADLLQQLKEADVPVQRVPRAHLSRIGLTVHHQGIAGDIGPFPITPLQRLMDLSFERLAILLALDHWQDTGNVGAIVRTAYALGAGGIIVPSGRTAPIGPALVKASAGACFHIPIAQGNVIQFLSRFQREGGTVVGLDLKGDDIRKGQAARPLALVIGAEGAGLSPRIRERADAIWTIPMAGDIGSLNAVAAATIALWEVLCRREGWNR